MKKVFVLVFAIVALSVGSIYAYNRNGGHYQGDHNGYSSSGNRGGNHNGRGYNKGDRGYNHNGRGYNNGNRGYGNCNRGGNHNGRGYKNGNRGYNHNSRGYNNSTRSNNYAPLTQVQIKKLDDIEVKYYEQLSNASLEIEKQNNVIRNEMRKDSPNKAKIDTAIDEKVEFQAKRQKLLLEMNLAMDEVINEAKDTDK